MADYPIATTVETDAGESQPPPRAVWRPGDESPVELSVSFPHPGLCVVAVAGELDLLSAPALLECVSEQLAAGPVTLVIDLGQVSFLGSCGVTALVKSSRYLERVSPGAVLYLSGVTARAVRRPLELVGLLPLLDTHPTLTEALNHAVAVARGEPAVQPAYE